jgi:cell division septal protein FtsQ
VSRRGLLSPRGAASLADLGERTPLVARQRVSTARRRARALARLTRAVRPRRLSSSVGALPARWLVTPPRFAVAPWRCAARRAVPGRRILAAAAIAPGDEHLHARHVGGRRRDGSLPEIRRADVVRELPNRVVISVEERRPFTLVPRRPPALDGRGGTAARRSSPRRCRRRCP